MHKLELNNAGHVQFYLELAGAIQMKDSDFRLRMDSWTLLATHLRMIHELDAVSHQH